MKTVVNNITIYEKDHAANVNANAYQTQGLGSLPDAKSAYVDAAFQAECVLKIEYPAKGTNAGLLKEERILQSKINDTDVQLMRIYDLKKSLDGNTFTVLAEPLFNDVRKHFMPVLDIPEQVGILVAWQRATSVAKPAINTNLYKIALEGGATTSMGTQHMEQANLLQFFAGKEGSLLQMRNPLEFKKDNGTMIISRRLGREHAISGVYTRNLKGLEYTINTQDVVTAYYPFAKYKEEGSDEETLIELPNKVIVQDNASLYTGNTKPIDFSEDETVKDVATLQTAFDAYVLANEAERTPSISAKVDLITLRNQQGYENFVEWQTVQLGDGVDVYHPEWDITLSARLMKYQYNILTDRYESLEIGDIKRTFLDDINNNFTNVSGEITDAVNNVDLSDVRNAIKELGEKTDQNTSDLNIIDGALDAVQGDLGNLTSTVDSQGRLINAQGQLIDGHGRLINEQGDLINSQGETINSQGQKIDSQGKIIDDQQTTINEIVDQLSDVVTLPQTEALLEEMGREITGNNGGNVVLDPPTRPERILIMDTASLATAKNVIQMNQAGIAFSTNGKDGPFTSAWTIDGIFNAKWIQTGILSGNNLQINLDTGEVTFVKGTIRNADLTFLMDITTGQIGSRGEFLSPNNTGETLPAGFNLMQGRLDFYAGTFGEASVSYGGIRTETHSGQYLENGIWQAGIWSGSLPAIALRMDNPDVNVWQSRNRAVLLSSSDYQEPYTINNLWSPTWLGYGDVSGAVTKQNIVGGGIGVAQRGTLLDEAKSPKTEAWMIARHGVYLASGYNYESTVNGGTKLTPSLVLGRGVVGAGATDFEKELAATSTLTAGFKVELKAKNISLWSGNSGKTELKGRRVDINGSGDSTSYGGMSFGSDGTGGRVWSVAIYNRTYAAGNGDLCITTAGTIGRKTSARKYKSEIQTATDVLEKAHILYDIKPASWYDKRDWESGIVKDGDPRYYGFIADEFHEKGLPEVVYYGDQGQVESLAYDRISIYMVPLIQEQKKQIDDLTQRLETLEALLN